MPLFSSLKSKMRRDSTSSSTTNPSQGNKSKDEKTSNNLQASDVLGDSPSFKGGSGNGNTHPSAGITTSQSAARVRTPSESAPSIKQKNSSSMLKMFSGARSPSSGSIASNTGSISKSRKRNSIMSSSVDNLARTPANQPSSPPVSNSAATAASLRSLNNNQNNGNTDARDDLGSLPTLTSTTAPGALLHAFNNPDATTPTSASFGSPSSAASNPRPSDLFAGKAMEWGSIGPGRDAPAPKAEDLQSFLKARRQWVPTFVTEDDAPTAAEKNQRLEDINFSSPATSTPTGVMSLKDLDASHERKRKLLGELPLTGGSIGNASSITEAPLATSSSPPSSSISATFTSRPGLNPPTSPPSVSENNLSSPGKEKPGRSTSFRHSIFSSNKRTNSKDQVIPSAPTSNVADQKVKNAREKSNAGVASSAEDGALGAGVTAAIAVSPSNPATDEASRAPKSSDDSQGTATAPPVEASNKDINASGSSTTNPSSGSADILTTSTEDPRASGSADILTASNDSSLQPSTASEISTAADNSPRPASSRIRESIDSSAQGFQTPEAGSTRTSMAFESGDGSGLANGADNVGDETVVDQVDAVAEAEASKVGHLPNLDDKDLESGGIVGTPNLGISVEPAPALSALSPEKPPRPLKADSRTPTTSRPPSPSTQPRSVDTLPSQSMN